MKRKRGNAHAGADSVTATEAAAAAPPAAKAEAERTTTAPNEIWVVSGTKIHAAVTKALLLLSDRGAPPTTPALDAGHEPLPRQVIIKGKDKGVTKAMTIAEIVKRRHDHTLYQGNHLTFLGLRTDLPDSASKRRSTRLPLLTIALSVQPFSEDEAALYHGLQAPSELSWPTALDSRKR